MSQVAQSFYLVVEGCHLSMLFHVQPNPPSQNLLFSILCYYQFLPPKSPILRRPFSPALCTPIVHVALIFGAISVVFGMATTLLHLKNN